MPSSYAEQSEREWKACVDKAWCFLLCKYGTREAVQDKINDWVFITDGWKPPANELSAFGTLHTNMVCERIRV